MQFDIQGILPNGSMAFSGVMHFIPRKGEEIYVNGYLYVVENVRYVLTEGTFRCCPVRLRVSLVNQ